WEYDYGHNLSDTAPIKVPGQTYQPPLLGVGHILNFTALSFPSVGGIAAGLSIAFSAVAAWLGLRRGGDHSRRARARVAASAAGMVTMLFLSGCTPQPRPIEFGADACDYCSMTIVDAQHAAELVTKKGRAYKFDAIECMLPYYQEHEQETPFDIVLVSDYARSGSLVDGREATFLISEAIPSPMGGYLSAFAETSEARAVRDEKGGELYDWAQIRVQFNR
ncbi:MAG: nitrous oxide reductase accessory protein NosL, partial [Lewinella sp.]|nr:nitrous oxide reductase accessory protein NosL [Lewinella sp.]